MPICVPFEYEKLITTTNSNEYTNIITTDNYKDRIIDETKCKKVDVAVICLSSLLDYLH